MENDIARMYSLVNGIVGFVRGPTQAMEIGEVESRLLAMVLEIGREGLNEFVRTKGTGYRGNEIVGSHGERLHYVHERRRQYKSVFGTIVISRAYYQARGDSGTFPLDGELNLPERAYSYLVQEISSKLAVNGSYEKACEVFNDIFLINVPIKSVERIVGDVCEGVAQYYEERPEPRASMDAVVTVVTVDKKGVVIRKPPSEETAATTGSSDPDRPGKKKMSSVISAHNIKRHARTVEDVTGELVEEQTSPSKPKPQVKHVWGSLTEGPEKTIERLEQAITDRLCWNNELVCILDGERSLWRLVYEYFPMAFFILDIFHVLEYISAAAHCFHKEKSPEAKRFVKERLRMLLTGNVGKMIGGLSRSSPKDPFPRPKDIPSTRSLDISNETNNICAMTCVWRKAIQSAAE